MNLHPHRKTGGYTGSTNQIFFILTRVVGWIAAGSTTRQRISSMDCIVPILILSSPWWKQATATLIITLIIMAKSFQSYKTTTITTTDLHGRRQQQRYFVCCQTNISGCILLRHFWHTPCHLPLLPLLWVRGRILSESIRRQKVWLWWLVDGVGSDTIVGERRYIHPQCQDITQNCTVDSWNTPPLATATETNKTIIIIGRWRRRPPPSAYGL